MTLNVDAVVQGITTGSAGAIVFWSFGLLRDRARNLILRRAIKRQLKRASHGSGIRGLSTSIANHLQKDFTIREVTIIARDAEYLLNATGEVKTSIPHKLKLTRADKAKLKRGEIIEGRKRVEHHSWRVDLGHDGFVDVLPFTSHEFILPPQAALKLDEPRCLRVVIEYETWTKKKRILEYENKEWSGNSFQQMLLRFREEVSSGRINEMRRLFGLPLIVNPDETSLGSTRQPKAPVASNYDTRRKVSAEEDMGEVSRNVRDQIVMPPGWKGEIIKPGFQ